MIASYFATKQFFKKVILELKKTLVFYAFIKIQNLPWRSIVAYIYNVEEKINTVLTDKKQIQFVFSIGC